MSDITTIYSALVTKLDSLYPATTYRKLRNPYTLELNDAFALNRGYGFYVGPATNTNRLQSNSLSIEREIVLVNTIIQRGTDLDISIREDAEITLLEDQFLAIKDFEGAPAFADQVTKMTYSSDGGIEFVFNDKQNYLAITSSFTLEYMEVCQGGREYDQRINKIVRNGG